MNRFKATLAGGLFLLVVPSATTAFASPKVGTARPNLKLVDAWARTYDTTEVGSRPLLVLYEDKDSANDNKAFKDELSKLAKGDAYKAKVVLLAVADLQGYDYWPTRGFVKDAMMSESRKAGTPIYCDWDGGAAKAFSVKPGVSNVMLYGKDGKLLFAYEGAMPEASRKELLEKLRLQVQE